ncbi:MAG: hypothetical protein HY300_07815 [Verrucomicrobia bacterium]|nr:hypothetical protein [Verrucomicrobiota bacterium]
MSATLTTERPAQAPTRVKPSASLLGKIAAVRRKYFAVAAGTGVFGALGIASALLLAGCLLDWWLDLAWGLRAFIFTADVAAVGWIITRHIVLPILHSPDDDAVALMVEHGKPQFQTRLIASLQLTRVDAVQPGTSSELVEALVDETERLARPVDFTEVISTRQLRRFFGWALVATGVAGFLFFKGEDISRDLLARALLSREIPVPRKTRVAEFSGNLRIGRGDSVRLWAHAKGVIPDTGRLVLKYSSGRSQEFALEATKTNRVFFDLTLENVQDSFDYTIYLGDGRSPAARVESVVRPTVARIDCTQVYPAYTGLGTVRRALGDLTLLSGSTLKLTVAASKEVARGSIKLIGLDREVPLKPNAQNPRELEGEFAVPTNALSGFMVQLVDKFDMASKDEAVYRIDLLPDKPPLVRITFPERKEELITQHARVLVGFEALDDFAVSQVFLRYKIDEGEEKGIELVLLDRTQRSVRNRYDWNVGALKPLVPEGATVEWWIEARDNNNVTGPGIGVSEHYVAKVVSEAEKRADLMARVGDSIGAIGDVAKDQETLNKRLGDLIQGRPDQPQR